MVTCRAEKPDGVRGKGGRGRVVLSKSSAGARADVRLGSKDRIAGWQAVVADAATTTCARNTDSVD